MGVTPTKPAEAQVPGDASPEPHPEASPSAARFQRARTAFETARSSVRARILVRFVVLLSLATVASLVLQRQILLSRLYERIDADLEQEVTELRALVGGRDEQGRCVVDSTATGGCAIGRDPRTGRPFGDDVRALFDTFLQRNIPSRFETMITFVDGRQYKVPPVRSELAESADDELAGLGNVRSPQRGEIETTTLGRLRYLAVPVAGGGDEVLGVFAVAQYVDLQADIVEQDIRVVSLVDLLLMAVASLLAFLVAGRALRPVRNVTEAAREIGEGDLSRRIDAEGRDEIADLADTFNKMLDRLERAFTTQRAFVDDAGHELRTPITIIRGHIDLLNDDADERAETMRIVNDELDRMSRIVDDLLILAKAERPDFLNPTDVDLAEITDELHTKAATLARRRWTIDHIGEGHVFADRQRLTQAVVQLAQNATAHTGPDDTIAIGSAVDGTHARIWVRDTGSGIEPADRERIFQRFSRGRSGPRPSPGAGLGLAIVRAIAEAHGGSVELVSEPGAGATFTLVLPMTPHPASEGAP